MKLSLTALEQINNSRSRMELALVMNVTEKAIYNAITLNKNDGVLTKASVIKFIKEKTGLSESEILTEAVEAANTVQNS